MTAFRLALPLLLLAACHKNVPPPAFEPPPEPPPADPEPRPQPGPSVPIPDPDEELGRVFFDFDASQLDPRDLAVLTEDAAILVDHPEIEVQVQGHADERGTVEYNLALGERRAAKMEQALVQLGVEPDRIETVSYGEELPIATGSYETAWEQNRRGEIVITSRGPGDEDVIDTLGRTGSTASR